VNVKDLMSLTQASDEMPSLSVEELTTACEDGDLEAVRLGGMWITTRKDFAAYLEMLDEMPDAPIVNPDRALIAQMAATLLAPAMGGLSKRPSDDAAKAVLSSIELARAILAEVDRV